MTYVYVILMILGLVAMALATWDAALSRGKFNLQSAGLALWMLATLLKLIQ